MSSNTTPIGPPLVFERGKKQPVTFSFTTATNAALDLTGKTLVFRLGTPGSTAIYELTLTLGSPASAGQATGVVDADVTPGSYEYHVEDTGADRILVRGACAVRAVIGDAP